MSKNSKMFRKTVIAFSLVVFTLMSITGCGKNEENNSVVADKMVEDNQESSQPENGQGVNAEKMEETLSEPTDGGGNAYNNSSEQVIIIAILISEDDYYYDNSRISYEEIIKMIENTEDNIMVELSDDNATYKAYSRLVEKLEEMKIEFVEQ